MSDLEVSVVGVEAAAAVHQVIQEAFRARPPIDPPADALSETVETVAEELAAYGGVLATLRGEPVGSMLFDHSGPGLMLRRFGVAPTAQGHGVASGLVRVAEEHALANGYHGLRVKSRVELPESIAFWEYHGYTRSGRVGVTLRLAKVFPRRYTLATADDVRDFGERLAGLLRAGDLLLLSGDLGAGKTTLTQGIGAGLGVRGQITSPTFVISRVHPGLDSGPPLVHVDAYRLGGIDELDDLDLDTSLTEAVTVVEWGEDVAESLADERLEIRIVRAPGGEQSLDDHDPRDLVLQPVGLRWLDSGLESLTG
ncbi:tRNA (adenosine(37)-N6)-threonylcarbamoyltransferase complex ATPase subunit type 1 TsaE [Nocardioides donggukensis]|uniref:tRNA threonylcarbamoyladenosine biosynthesis protein TsaE n=1 Tax=Nocardioides donggukensis TaxID=2774019 RepID=A0A927PYN7_9ACTN|nr:tRNA (adenosine(37)-N6)-threonylcarbamoyltransferase complex ATPase subunit type 1 TsaE [Nocardioides donggukensis]MBD8868543.1 tRNA (adenosine(37)-N6)-threonylcarbamoyltransferase complex ATPase subunit type 1 TsaE [Nocardioides donggukensis]